MARTEQFTSRRVQDIDKTCAFKSIQLLKEQTLGSGFYGSVCKVKCDELICAAKIFNQAGFDWKFLSQIKHPNIVQYLGTYHAPEINTPVLLMELMDENLTHFLESSSEEIPYHIQVNLSSDIAQGLSFLHSNEIIHCNLSSNNVLLLAGNRAKITDIGLLNSITCSRAHAYMPPEALNEPLICTEKVDIFSFGVLMIQIATRQFPDPLSNELEAVSTQISEAERRQEHISLIKLSHPLLPITLNCLNEANDRPDSKDLCQTIDSHKKPLYRDEKNDLEKKNEQLELVDHELQTFQDELESVKQQLSLLHEKLEFNKDIEMVSQQRINLEHNESPFKQTIHNQPRTELSVQFKWETLPDAPNTITVGSSTTIGKKMYMCGVSCGYVFNLSTYEWQKLPAHPNFEYTVINIEGILTTIGGWFHGWNTSEKKSNQLYCFMNEKWVKHYPPMSTKRYAPAAVYSNFTLVVAGGTDNRNSSSVEVLNTPKKQWSTVSSLPFSMKQPSMVICGEHIYIHNSYSSNSVFKCSLFSLAQSRQNSNVWDKIASLPVGRSTLATINGLLLAMGGETSPNNRTNDVYLYNPNSNSWGIISQMAVARYQCLTALLPDNKLIVVGGDSLRIKIELASIF